MLIYVLQNYTDGSGTYAAGQTVNVTETFARVAIGMGQAQLAESAPFVSSAGIQTAGTGAMSQNSGTAYAGTGASTAVLVLSNNSATPSINSDAYGVVQITGQSVPITSFTTNLTGTPTNSQALLIEITGTTAIAITWGAKFENGNCSLPTSTIGTSTLTVGFLWDSVNSKWACQSGGGILNTTISSTRIVPRVLALSANSATPAVNTDLYDDVEITAQTAAITGFSMSGTPNPDDCLFVHITGTASVAITWGASFEASTIALPTTTSGTAKLSTAFKYNSATLKWRCVGYA